MIFKVMVEPFLGGSNANAPTQSDSKLYDRQSYSAQAKEVALGAGLGKLGGQLLGKFLGPIWPEIERCSGC
jgi:hypothetical protein